MSRELADYEAAFDALGRPCDPGRLHARVTRAVTRDRRSHNLALASGVVLLAGSIALALAGSPAGWGYAGFALLVALPGRWKRRREWQAELAAVDSADDIRQLCHREARRRMAGAFGAFLVLGGLGGLYLLTGAVAWALDRSPWPGMVAGALVIVWALRELFVTLPHATRETAVLEAGDDA